MCRNPGTRSVLDLLGHRVTCKYKDDGVSCHHKLLLAGEVYSFNQANTV